MQQQQKHHIQKKKLVSPNLPRPKFLLSDFQGDNTLKENLISFITNFNKISESLYLHGPNSCQKTTVSKAILYELSLLRITSCFILFSDLVSDLQNYNFDAESKSRIDSLYSNRLIIIDDCFDPRKTIIYRSGYQVPFIDSFFRKIFETTNIKLILTSNINIVQIDQNIFTLSLVHLLNRNCKALHFTTIPTITFSDIWK